MNKIEFFRSKNWSIADKNQAICSGLGVDNIPIFIMKSKNPEHPAYQQRKPISRAPSDINKYITIYENRDDIVVFIFNGKTYHLRNDSNVCFLTAFIDGIPIILTQRQRNAESYHSDELINIFQKIAEEFNLIIPEPNDLENVLKFNKFLTVAFKDRNTLIDHILKDNVMFGKFMTRLLIINLRTRIKLRKIFKKKAR